MTRLPESRDEVGAYEKELAAHLDIEHVIAVSSGTAAIQTALDAAGVQSGDEVLVPALSVVMSAAPIIHLGARPVIVDCDPTGTGFDHDDLRRKAGERTSAILHVHLWGRGDPDVNRLHRFATERRLAVVVDACQALGTTTGGVQTGLNATAACFSTHDLKILATGEGGFIATADGELAARARAYRSHWLNPPAGRLPLSRPAHNFRFAEPLAAIGRRELARFANLLRQRREQATLLLGLVAGNPHLRAAQTPKGWNGYSPLLHLLVEHPRAFCEHLAHSGVPNSTGTFRLVPLDQQPAFRDRTTGPCPTAAAFLDGILAVTLTRHDEPARIRRYAAIITEEAARWAGA